MWLHLDWLSNQPTTFQACTLKQEWILSLSVASEFESETSHANNAINPSWCKVHPSTDRTNQTNQPVKAPLTEPSELEKTNRLWSTQEY